MVPQNNYTLKHNSPTKSHLHEEVRTDYWIMENMNGHHIIPANQKLMRNEYLKTHIGEVERC